MQLYRKKCAQCRERLSIVPLYSSSSQIGTFLCGGLAITFCSFPHNTEFIMQRKWGTYIHPNGLSAERWERRASRAASLQGCTCRRGKLIESAWEEGNGAHRFCAEVKSEYKGTCLTSWNSRRNCHQSWTHTHLGKQIHQLPAPLTAVQDQVILMPL